MKSQFLLFVFLAGFEGTVVSQPVLTAGIVPSVGKQFKNIFLDTAGLSAGPSGASVSWDYSGYSPNGTTTTFDVILPSQTSYAATFSSSELAMMGDDNSYGYYSVSPSEFFMDGAVSPSGVVLKYSDPGKLYSFPMAYGSVINDNIACTFVSSGVTFYRTGTLTSTYDAYGTLTAPAGTFNNILRIKLVQNLKDSAYDSGTKYIYLYNIITYTWYDPTKDYTLLSLSFSSTEININGFLYGTSISEYLSYSEPITGISENNINFLKEEIYPNPVSNMVRINYFIGIDSDINIKLNNSTGSEIKLLATSASRGYHSIDYDVSGLPAGIYYIVFEEEYQKTFRSIVISH